MGNLQIFENEIFQVSAKIDGEIILFNVEQVAKCLGLTRTMNGKEYIRWERVNSYLPDSCPQVGKGSLIPEALAYKLAFKASNEVAEKFQDWLAIEVIPSIRQNGGYIETNENDDDASIMAKALLIANKTIENNKRKIVEQQLIIDTQKPKVLFAEAVQASHTSILIGEFAKILKQNGVDVGQKRLFEWLRDNGYLIKRKGSDYNSPTQKSMELGLFEIKETPIHHNSGEISISRTSKITGKGQAYFINKFLNRAVAM